MRTLVLHLACMSTHPDKADLMALGQIDQFLPEICIGYELLTFLAPPVSATVLIRVPEPIMRGEQRPLRDPNELELV